METIESNKMITEFMKHTGRNALAYEFQECMGLINKSYHNSWDWLIPVIDKITSMDEYIKFKDHTCSMVDDGGIYINTRFIENTFNNVVEFIEWYNTNK